MLDYIPWKMAAGSLAWQGLERWRLRAVVWMMEAVMALVALVRLLRVC